MSSEGYQFNVKCFIDAAEVLVCHDEVDRALALLDNLPAFFRDNIPFEVLELRNDILRKIATPAVYAQSEGDMGIDLDRAMAIFETVGRGKLILKDVTDYNQQGITPNLIDLGPGEYWLPMALSQLGAQFHYTPIYLNYRAFNKAGVPIFYDRMAPTIFSACEIIEHLNNEEDIKSEVMRFGYPDILHISTPRYTINPSMSWRSKENLEHLRAYTPKEFFGLIQKIFPEYDAVANVTDILHLRLTMKLDFKSSYDGYLTTKGLTDASEQGNI